MEKKFSKALEALEAFLDSISATYFAQAPEKWCYRRYHPILSDALRDREVLAKFVGLVWDLQMQGMIERFKDSTAQYKRAFKEMVVSVHFKCPFTMCLSALGGT